MKLLVVEDHPIVIAGCRALFSKDDGVTMVEARTASAARIAMKEEEPDVTVININLPDGSGLELTREFVAQIPEVRIVVFAMSDTPMLAIQAIECGAKSYVSKNGNPFDLRDAVLAVSRGDTWISDDLTQEMALLRAGARGTTALLSDREHLVLRMLARGRSMAEIANDISVSYKTVAADCAALRTKLSARTSSEMVRIAVELKLI
ncbi:response regulator transcription factor [Hyphomicrobium facile]|uniref:DNA-binding response regulator, NarL/FixJ family, contains REC and HTH domains n=1 Tax=Hyphomicrobium facile TaxID=51670 RepID=A0A1I7NR03_9HYPH|nr:response regulator transcription factor [Hyphomicrobium facile]SFV37022.1 DNA-binding response regulator, NarL/FixJ family, contains REC and HTH domains [Hyphomicrobium facile]